VAAFHDIGWLIERLRATPGCDVLPSAGVPILPVGLVLPDDLVEFYGECGGARLFAESAYPVAIAPPDQFISSNLAILGQLNLDDRSDQWFTVGITPDGEYLSIDLDPARLGRCYDSFHEAHGLIGDCAIIATSFSDLLSRLLSNQGRYWYWLDSDFRSLGDAYDD
jgi:hypothetical protein